MTFGVYDMRGERVVAFTMPDPELDQRGLRRLHLEAVTLQREFPEFLGPRRPTNCPFDRTAEPRSALAAFMRQHIKQATP